MRSWHARTAELSTVVAHGRSKNPTRSAERGVQNSWQGGFQLSFTQGQRRKSAGAHGSSSMDFQLAGLEVRTPPRARRCQGYWGVRAFRESRARRGVVLSVARPPVCSFEGRPALDGLSLTEQQTKSRSRSFVRSFVRSLDWAALARKVASRSVCSDYRTSQARVAAAAPIISRNTKAR